MFKKVAVLAVLMVCVGGLLGFAEEDIGDGSVPYPVEVTEDESVPWPVEELPEFDIEAYYEDVAPQFWWCVDWHCVRICMRYQSIKCLKFCEPVCKIHIKKCAICLAGCMAGVYAYCVYQCWIC